MKQLLTTVTEQLKCYQKKLHSLKQENSLLKYKLSDLVDRTEGEGFLQIAESLQSELLQKDLLLEELSKKLFEIYELINKYNGTFDLPLRIQNQQKQIQEEIAEYETEFEKLSQTFDAKIANR